MTSYYRGAGLSRFTTVASLALLLPTLAACGSDSKGGDDPQGMTTPPDAGPEDAQTPVDSATPLDATPADAEPVDSSDGNDGGAGDGGSNDGGTAASYAVGTVRFELKVSDSRTIPVQLWYPAVESARAEATTGHPTQELEPAGALRDRLTSMLSNSPNKCTSKTFHAAVAPEAVARAEKFPALVFSHCMDCVRFSSFTVAEHLASLGFVVAAPDHVGGTLYDGLGTLTEEFLVQRTKDVTKVFDTLLDAQSTLLPASLKGKIDADKLGMYGHSYGAITTGRVLLNDTRVKAGAFLAAPMDPPLVFDNPVANATKPALFIEALEDETLLNNAIEKNFDEYPKPVWLVQMKDSGHFSVTDIANIDGKYKEGCGTDFRRQDAFAEFTYLDNDQARGIAKSYVAAFFEAQLNGKASGTTYLGTATPADKVVVKKRP